MQIKLEHYVRVKLRVNLFLTSSNRTFDPNRHCSPLFRKPPGGGALPQVLPRVGVTRGLRAHIKSIWGGGGEGMLRTNTDATGSRPFVGDDCSRDAHIIDNY